MRRTEWQIKRDLKEKQVEQEHRLSSWNMGINHFLLPTFIKRMQDLLEKHKGHHRKIRVRVRRDYLLVEGVRKETKREMQARVRQAKKEWELLQMEREDRKKAENFQAASDLADNYPEEFLKLVQTAERNLKKKKKED